MTYEGFDETEGSYWRITDFASKVSEVCGDEIHYVSVDRWFVTLEKQGIHYVLRSQGKRLYDERDLEIAVYIKQGRDRKLPLQPLFEQIPLKFDVRPFPHDDNDKESNELVDVNELQKEVIANTIAAVQKENGNLYRDMSSLIDEKLDRLTTLLPGEEQKATNKIEERQNRLNETLALKKIEQKLRKKALGEWLKKPEGERFTGVLFKKEDISKRDHFIESYMEEHYEEEYKREFGIEE
ncbi:hypothetical protein [Pontibacillus halophilus]|uniref:hypothetical protein n=1 Tax=Pontibacillus halophilus TaxID=516704 RepID=UPI000423470B|nr:hypothetical protein [Pontibacillus halophilus]